MKTHSLRCWFLAGSFGLAVLTSVRADEEADLIAVLQSNAAPVQKAEACKRLRIVGTPRAVPELAPLLLQDRTSQAARYALEAIPGPEAGAALRRALTEASSPLQAGLADSLGWRRDSGAVSLLIPLLANADGTIATAAATALGRIGGSDAVAALRAVQNQPSPAVRPAVIEGLLRSADEQLAAGNRPGARAVYQSLLAPAEPEVTRVAAHLGMMRSADDGGFALMVKALEGDDPAAQTAALALAGTMQHPDATRTLAALLPRSSPALQVALVSVLRARGDVGALPALAAAARSPDVTVRIAAMASLGTLGDASVVPLLAEAATIRDAAEQMAAREALVGLRSAGVSVALLAQLGSADATVQLAAQQMAAREALVSLRGEGVSAALVTQLASAAPAVQLELAQALTARGETSAVPALLELARTDAGAGRRAVLQALGSLADGSQVQSLVGLLVAAKSAEARDEVRRVFEALVLRAGDAGRLDVDPIVRGITSGALETRQALLQVGVLFANDQVRVVLRAALKDPDERIRLAAARALCDARDPALLPDLLAVARETKDPGLRSLALEGSVRLATEDGAGLSPTQRTEALSTAFSLAGRVADKRMVLAGLAQVPNRATLALADQACADAAVRAEAEQACLQIAGQLGAAEFEAVGAALTRMSAGASMASVQDKARALLKVLDSGWLYAGPYRQAGKEAQQLFDVAFPPEQAGAGDVRWQRAPGTTDVTRAGEVDLGGVVGGNHCVVYAKTRVNLPAAQAVVFSIGSDDGIKLWVNGDLVHANNAVRGLTPDQDRAKGRLRDGWNDLFVKITQHTAGCGFTLRVLTDGGQEVPGVRFEAHGRTAP